jgi:hypothetical protein
LRKGLSRLDWRKRVGVEPTIAIRDNDLRF